MRQDWTQASWKKATASGSGDNCVEHAVVNGIHGVRDSKLGDSSPILEFSQGEWDAFKDGVARNEF